VAGVASARAYLSLLLVVGVSSAASLADWNSSAWRAGSPCGRLLIIWNESVARFFHQQMAKTVSLIVGEPVIPSYVYAASYVSGAVLKKHIDRNSANSASPCAWTFPPSRSGKLAGRFAWIAGHGTVTVYQSLGDGLVYRGPRVPHYRDTLPDGKTSTSIFFHYVPAGFTGSLD